MPAFVSSLRSTIKPWGTRAAAQNRWLVMPILLRNQSLMILNCIKIESEPLFDADMGSRFDAYLHAWRVAGLKCLLLRTGGRRRQSTSARHA